MKKTPCALLINDIHVSKDNILEFHKNWDEAISVCNDNDIDLIVVGGDMWLSRSAQTLPTLMAVREAILKATKDNSIEIILVSGNHDKTNQEAIESYNHVFSDYEGVTVVDTSLSIDLLNNNRLHCVSYFPENGSFCEHLEYLKSFIDSSCRNVLYIHEGINGGLSTAREDELPTHVFNGFDSVLVGHYHDRKKISGTNIEYIGASRQHNFGEDEEKGYTILYDDGSTLFVKNEVNQRYKVIDVDVDDMDDAFMAKLSDIKSDSRYKLKVRIKCSSAQSIAVDKQQLADCGANKIELITEQTEVLSSSASNFSQKFDKAGIKREYTSFCSAKSFDNQLGLYYLDKLS